MFFTVVISSLFCSSHLDIPHLVALHTVLKWLTLLHFLHIMPYAGHLLSGWLDPQYLHVLVLIISASVCSGPIICIRLASSCFASIRTCSLVTLSVLSFALISLTIGACMPSLSRPHMNYSFIHLILLLIFTFFCFYSYSFYPLLNIFIFAFFTLQNQRDFSV